MKLVVADPKTGKTYQTELDEGKAKILYGKKIAETVNGDTIGLPGYELEITGGSDKQGFPMRRDLHGSNRKRLMLSTGPGFHPTRRGERRRKSVRGSTVSEEIAQINAKVLKEGTKSLDKAFAKGEEEKAGEKAPKEKPAEKKPKEEKPTEKKEEPKEKPAEKKLEEEPKKEEPKEKPPQDKKAKPKETEKPKEEPKKEETKPKEEPKKEGDKK